MNVFLVWYYKYFIRINQMDIINKKRDQKVREKKDKKADASGIVKDGTVRFKYDDGKVKKSKPVGDKKTSKKFVGIKDKEGDNKKKRIY